MFTLEESLKTIITHVHFSDHVMDNTFLSFDIKETKRNMEKLGYTPIGVCLEPSYRTLLGPALVFRNRDGDTGWVHVGQHIMIEWLIELKMMPPDDAVWDWDVIRKYVWNR